MTLDRKGTRLTKTPAGAMAGAPPRKVAEESSALPLQEGVRAHTGGPGAHDPRAAEPLCNLREAIGDPARRS